MNDKLEAIDSLILGVFKEDSMCSLTYLSKKLNIPKTQIIKRIKYLCENDLLYFKENGFYTTYDGNKFAISPDNIEFTGNNLSEDANEKFCIEQCRYIPSPEMFKRQSKK